MIELKKKHLFTCALFLLLANCSSKKIQEKQVQWRTECEQMMLKGADGVMRHHDCFNRCSQHYTHYCTNRCENALMEGGAKREDVDKHCRNYLQQYMNRKCHHLCDLTHEELQEYRASYVQRIQEKFQEGSGCEKWSKEDAFLTPRKKTDPLDDTINTFREPTLDKRQARLDQEKKHRGGNKMSSTSGEENEGVSNIFAAFGGVGEKKKSKSDHHTSSDEADEKDDDVANNDGSEDQDSDQEPDLDQDDDAEESPSRQPRKRGIKGYKPLKTFSLTGDDPSTTEDFAQQAKKKMKEKSLQSIHTLEDEIIHSRNTLEAAKDIRSLLKGVKDGS